jgi:methyl-accepting chemotaxis protein
LLTGITLTLSQREISRLAEEQAKSIARESSEEISKWFGGYVAIARDLARVLEGYKEIPATQRRDYFNMMMRQLLGANPELRATYSHWAPTVLDGMDADYANTPGTDETGRFKSAWNNNNGVLVVNPIAGFEWNMVMQTPVFHEEFMLEPTVYMDPRGNTLIAILGNPVRDKETGALIGQAGTSLEMAAVQAMVEKIKPFGDGHRCCSAQAVLSPPTPTPNGLA